MRVAWLTWKRISVVVVLLVASGLLSWHFWPRHKIPTDPQIASLVSGATDSLAVKDYQTAADTYQSAAQTSIGENDYVQAKSLMDEAIAKVPNTYLGFDFWLTMYTIAAHQNDKSLEISSLQKAIAAGSANDVPASVIQNYQTQLKQLNNAQ